MKSRCKYLLLVIIIFMVACSKGIERHIERKNIFSKHKLEHAVDKKEDIDHCRNHKTINEKIYNRKDDRDKLAIYFMDIYEINSQWGDSTLICFPNGKTMMIDAGTFPTGKHIVSRLDKLGIDRIDYAVVTHMHDDHFQGFYTVMEYIDIGIMYIPDLPHHITKEQNDKWESSLAARSIECSHIGMGDILNIGDINMEVLSPEISEENTSAMLETWATENVSTQSKVANNLSIVMKLTYRDISALFTGDIQFEKEEELVNLYGDNLKANILKIPHHGHLNSGSRNFIEAVNADIAIAMGNVLLQPYIYTEYTEVGTKVYLTYADGMIKLISCGQELDIFTEHDRSSYFRELYN